jgi:cytochrome c peroxidase
LFRRPLPATNLPFLATVMWDGRQTFPGQSIHFDLSDQANSATLGHAAATHPLTREQADAIVNFESGLFTAQSSDNTAGVLDAQRGAGGPIPLSRQRFYIGINDVLNPGFDRRAFTLFDAWHNLPSSGRDPYTDAREAIARGQEIFNTRIFTIENVRGVNDTLGVAALPGTCTTCHNTPNVGNHSTSLPLDLGLTSAAVRTPDLPLYTFRNRTTGELFQTTDPGRALITGKWKDMALFKGPILRGLAAPGLDRVIASGLPRKGPVYRPGPSGLHEQRGAGRSRAARSTDDVGGVGRVAGLVAPPLPSLIRPVTSSERTSTSYSPSSMVAK